MTARGIEAGAAVAKELGAKRAIVLPVSVAAHSPLMAEAAEGMRAVLADVAVPRPATTLLANADARADHDRRGRPGRARRPPHGRRRLGRAPSSAMAAAGVTTFVEVGPGKVLTGLIKRIAPDAEIIAADDPASLDRLLDLAAVTA